MKPNEVTLTYREPEAETMEAKDLTITIDASQAQEVFDARLKEITSQAFVDVAAERRRQVQEEGWTAKHDDFLLDDGSLAAAAACYANPMAVVVDGRGVEIGPPNPETLPLGWPENWVDWYKPKSRRRDLVRAAALILAEIERLDRADATSGGESDG